MSDSTEPNYVVCMRVSDTDSPVEGSTQDKCAKCDADVWVSVASRAFIQDSGAMILCVWCGMDQMREDQKQGQEVEIVTTELQKREVQKNLLEHGL